MKKIIIFFLTALPLLSFCQNSHTIDDYIIELYDISTVTDFYQNTYYNALEECSISWTIVEAHLPYEWEFSVCFPNCYNPGITNGLSNFNAGTNNYLNCHFYPNNTSGQGIIKMEITTNLVNKDTVIWIGTASEPTNLLTNNHSNTNVIESIFTLDGKKIDGILTNFPVLIKYKSGLIKKYQKIE